MEEDLGSLNIPRVGGVEYRENRGAGGSQQVGCTIEVLELGQGTECGTLLKPRGQLLYRLWW